MSEFVVEFGYEPPCGVKERIVRYRDCEYEDEPWNCAAPYYREPDGFCFWAKRKEVDA